MTRKDKEYFLFDFIPKFKKSIEWLFNRENLDGIFPVYFILYSHKNNFPIHFAKKGKMTGYEKGRDILQDKLYEASLPVLGGDDANIEKLSASQILIKSIDRGLFDECYTYLVEEVLCATDLADGTQMNPNFRIARTIANIISEHGCNDVMCAYSGIGTYAVACRQFTYLGVEGYAPANLIAEFLCSVYDIPNKEFITKNPSERPDKKYDAVIGNLPVDVDFFNVHRWERHHQSFNDLQDAFINQLVKRKFSNKCAALLVHFEFANNFTYDTTRRFICNKGMLESVIALPENIFKESFGPSYILVLDFERQHDSAIFYDARQSLNRQKTYGSLFDRNDYDLRECVRDTETIIVSYDTIKKLSWSFNPSAYLQDAECREGMELVRLGDLVDIPSWTMAKGERFISSDRLSDRFEFISKHIVPEAPSKTDGVLVEGPSVLLALSRGARREIQNLRCGICDEPGQYSVEFFLPVLKPKKDKILADYLALALISDSSFARYLKSVQEYWCDTVRSSYLLERKIPVLTDLAAQKKAVLDALGRADMANITYNIIVAGADERVQRYRCLLSKYGCNIISTVQCVHGPDGLEDVLHELSSKGVPLSRKVDAVIFESNIPYLNINDTEEFSGLDAILDLKLSRDYDNIPFFASSDESLDIIQSKARISLRRLMSLNNGHFFLNDEKHFPSEALFSSLREELDRMLSPEARVRSRHKEVFEAAEWIDEHYPEKQIHSSEIISDFLMAIEEGVETQKNLSDLRNVAHRIIEILKEYNAVPQLDNGAIPQLLYENEYKDKSSGVVYHQDFSLMPRSLSSSLVSLINIGNEATHSFSHSRNLGTSMLQILMEFICWFYNNKQEFSETLTNYWHKGNNVEEKWIDKIGTVNMKVVGHEQVWFSGDVRLFIKGKTTLTIGDKVHILKCSPNNLPPKVPELKYLAFPEDKNHQGGYYVEKKEKE